MAEIPPFVGDLSDPVERVEFLALDIRDELDLVVRGVAASVARLDFRGADLVGVLDPEDPHAGDAASLDDARPVCRTMRWMVHTQEHCCSARYS